MKTILIVDDEPDVRSMMALVFRAAGYNVLEAEDGGSALAIATAENPDLIVSDVMMDNVNGFMLFELLRKDPVTADIPIILVTGVAQHAGAWDSDASVSYLQKPVDMNDLLAAVKKYL